MARWGKGDATVTQLIDNRHLQRVAADSETAISLLASAKRHVASARLTVDGDPEASYSLAYDAAAEEASEAIQVAVACIASAERLLELEQLGVF